MPPSLLRVVQLTSPGRGAIAALLVESPGALGAVEKHLRTKSGRPLTSYPTDQLVFGRFGPPPCEQVVVRRRNANSVEVNCHGGLAAVAMIENILVAEGCQCVGWRDWAAGHYADPITAAAHTALAEATTERTATILLDQYHGALHRAFEEIEQAIDKGYVAAARTKIDELLARARLGRHLIRPWQVVLAGRPNVGKSSLVNALVGYPRAIVHPQPGTTRDVVSVRTAIDGWPVELADTAGLHAAGEGVERAGIERAHARLAAADLVVLIFDRSAPWCQADEALIQTWPKALVVHNKCDLPPAPGWGTGGLATSALGGFGIEALAQAIADRLVPDPPPAGAAVPFAVEHLECLARLAERVKGE